MNPSFANSQQRKIIHIDMDCFYAAIEIRDNPSLTNKPVAVGGSPDKRGVISTCNYIARKYGIHSAMATAVAYRQCKDLVVIPVDMKKYQQVSKNIQAIFYDYSPLVEPLSLDEAYIDVTAAIHYQGSATLIAEAIRKQIFETEKLTASAGVAPNKFLAKIASGWKKPNGIMVITPKEVDEFVKKLAVDKLFGVGKVNAAKLHQFGLKTCEDVQQVPLGTLIEKFGKLGKQLYEQARGIDHRAVESHRLPKSLSVEETFPKDIENAASCLDLLTPLFEQLKHRFYKSGLNLPIKNVYIKIKYADFKLSTAEMSSNKLDIENFINLLKSLIVREEKPIRLLGLGIHFDEKRQESCQQSLHFDIE